MSSAIAFFTHSQLPGLSVKEEAGTILVTACDYTNIANFEVVRK
ncbi:hypothetical protein [Brevibacillus sp. NL20B1]|nr:hypothetical protein [Brevibacillus sp. NL20B1]